MIMLALADRPTAPTLDDASPLLDALMSDFSADNPEGFLFALQAQLRDLRANSGAAWQSHWREQLQTHPAIEIARRCPMALHAATRPRGYPGDAALLDMLYRHSDAQPIITDAITQRIHATHQAAAVARSVRYRRMLLADAIDQTAITVPDAAVLSLACGHLREAAWSNALTHGGIHRFVAADQDERSLATIRQDYGPSMPALQPTFCTVRDVIRGTRLGDFDFVYAAGLYDYLPKPVAEALTSRLFAMLKPGGRLLIGNFGTGLIDTAYMEVVMDWSLIWRSPDEIAAFSAGIDPASIAHTRVFADPTGTCWYFDLVRQ
jgi:extracellular factor (EF) 3-hydroxypalmitic acid methyl ester biosynthesis protein